MAEKEKKTQQPTFTPTAEEIQMQIQAKLKCITHNNSEFKWKNGVFSVGEHTKPSCLLKYNLYVPEV